MQTPRLSILIPSRTEKYLQKTVEDILAHKEADTEIIIGYDGTQEKIPIAEGYRAVFSDTIIGQRAMTNKLARLSEAEYIMKLDAHCSFSQGFDRVLLDSMDDKTVMTPMLCRLDAEQWNIIAQPFTKKYYFDTNLVFQYGKQEDEKYAWGLVETMALQGSCFIVSREKYWEWNLCAESWGSWGCQGFETASKAWLSGGRVVTNTDVFYGHLFRGAGQNVEDIPYVRTKEEIDSTRKKAFEFLKHPKMPWLIEKFKYPCDWTESKVKELCV